MNCKYCSLKIGHEESCELGRFAESIYATKEPDETYSLQEKFVGGTKGVWNISYKGERYKIIIERPSSNDFEIVNII